MKKRNLIVTSLAVILAVALAAGGTLAYFSDTSVTATNEVDPVFNWVKLTETKGDPEPDGNGNITNDAYEIIPGTSQAKDPTVNVSYSVDSYVYVTVEDTSGGLITWAVADGWTLLTGTDEYDADGNLTSAVYYRLVDATAYKKTATKDGVTYYTNSFSVLKEDSISYSSSITNADVVDYFDEYGNPTFLNNDIKLTFQAYIMQADISGDDGVNESAVQCWQAMAGQAGLGVAAINGKLYTTLTEAISDAANGETVTLLTDIKATAAVTYNNAAKSITLDLNGNTITNSGTESYVLSVTDGTLTIADSAKTGAISGSESSQVGIQLTGGTLNVSGGTISGSSGILTSGGSLEVSGGAVKGLSESYETVSMTYNGDTVSAYKDTVDSLTAVNGSGIFIVAGNDNNLTVNISGGTVSTADYDNNHDICVVKLTNGTALGVTINVTGGTFGGEAGDCQNYYLAYDWETNEEYSWITLTDEYCLLGGMAGKYMISGGTGLSAGWNRLSGASPY